jgi:hypothetical protein
MKTIVKKICKSVNLQVFQRGQVGWGIGMKELTLPFRNWFGVEN